MSGPMTHMPAVILRQLLADLGLGTHPDITLGGNWPMFQNHMPDDPNNCIRLGDTEGSLQGRYMFGETQENEGIQVLIRSEGVLGWKKAKDICVAMDNIVPTYVYVDEVGDDLFNAVYLVESVSRTSGILSLGIDGSNSRRRLYSLNFLTTITQESVGTGT